MRENEEKVANKHGGKSLQEGERKLEAWLEGQGQRKKRERTGGDGRSRGEGCVPISGWVAESGG